MNDVPDCLSISAAPNRSRRSNHADTVGLCRRTGRLSRRQKHPGKSDIQAFDYISRQIGASRAAGGYDHLNIVRF